MKISSFIKYIFLIITCCFPLYSWSEIESEAKKKHSNIAVLNFTSVKVSVTAANVVSNVIQDELINSGRFIVIERKSMEQILKEQAFQQTGCTTQECAVEIGKILNCRFMVVGEVIKAGDEYQVSVRVVNVETTQVTVSKIEYTDSEKGLRFAAVKIVEYIVSRIGEEPELKEEKTTKIEKKLLEEALKKIEEIPRVDPNLYIKQKIEDLNDRAQTYKTLTTASAVICGGSLIISLIDAVSGNEAYQKYKNATSRDDAIKYRGEAESWDKAATTWLIVGGAAVVPWIIFSSLQSGANGEIDRLKKQLSKQTNLHLGIALVFNRGFTSINLVYKF